MDNQGFSINFSLKVFKDSVCNLHTERLISFLRRWYNDVAYTENSLINLRKYWQIPRKRSSCNSIREIGHFSIDSNPFFGGRIPSSGNS